MHWAESQQPGWVEQHIESWANIAGTVLGLPKAASALLSGALPATAHTAGGLAGGYSQGTVQPCRQLAQAPGLALSAEHKVAHLERSTRCLRPRQRD
jgi:hypothetical protein